MRRGRVLLGGLVLLAGCKGFTPTVTRAMANATGCPEDKIQVQQTTPGVYQASGCGKQGVYECSWPDGGNRKCVRVDAPAPKQTPGTGTPF